MGRSSSAEEILIAKMVAGVERRKQQRFDCEGPAEVVDLESGFLYRGEVKDLSLTGCFIVSPAKLDLARRTDVEISLSVNGDSLNTPARLIVVRPQSGAAFEFAPLDPETRNAVLVLIRKLTEESANREAKQIG
jgi:hypothetical protein